MASLEALQRQFLTTLCENGVPALGASRLPPEQGTAIYRRNYRRNHADALATTYTSVQRLTGPSFFRQLGTRYLQDFPPDSGDMNDFGAHFPEFLDAFLHRVPGGEALPFLPDVARTDLACWEVLLAPRAVPLQLARLLDWPAGLQGRARLRLAPSCRVLLSDHPVLEWRHRVTGDEQPVQPGGGSDAVLICRPADDVQVHGLDREIACLLQHWQAATLDEALSALLGRHSGVAVEPLFAQLNALPLSGDLWIAP